MRLSPLVGFFSTALAWVKESKLNLPWYLFGKDIGARGGGREGGLKGYEYVRTLHHPLMYYTQGGCIRFPCSNTPFYVFHC